MNSIRPKASQQYVQAATRQLQHRLRFKLGGWIPSPILDEIGSSIQVFYSGSHDKLLNQSSGACHEEANIIDPETGASFRLTVDWSNQVHTNIYRQTLDGKQVDHPDGLPSEFLFYRSLFKDNMRCIVVEHVDHKEMRLIFPIERSRKIWTTVEPGKDVTVDDAFGIISVVLTDLVAAPKTIRQRCSTANFYAEEIVSGAPRI